MPMTGNMFVAPAVDLCMGAEGRLSRFTMPILTFCTHQHLQGAVPGQLPADDMLLLLHELGLALAVLA